MLALKSSWDDLCEAMNEVDELKLTEERRASFKERMIRLLGIESLGTFAKAKDLQAENERTFCDARILTDLRPVFGKSIQDGPKGLVIVHLLKLGYHQDQGEHESFFVALDAEDLNTLKAVIERAEIKAEVIKSKISGGQPNVAFFDRP